MPEARRDRRNRLALFEQDLACRARKLVLDAGTAAPGLQLETAGLTRAGAVVGGAGEQRAAPLRRSHLRRLSTTATRDQRDAIAEGEGSPVFSRRRSTGHIAALYGVVLGLRGLINPPVVETDSYIL